MTDAPHPRKLWRAIIKMAPAAGPSWTPRWILDLMDDEGDLPDDLMAVELFVICETCDGEWYHGTAAEMCPECDHGYREWVEP